MCVEDAEPDATLFSPVFYHLFTAQHGQLQKCLQ